jgi:hypothetical protein
MSSTTRSGKIIRRLLRSVAKRQLITQDISTFENPAALDQLAERNRKVKLLNKAHAILGS